MNIKLLLLTVLSLITAIAFSQVVLRGKITNQTGVPLQGVTVALKHGQITRTMQTDTAGAFVFASIAAEGARLTAHHIGFDAFSTNIALPQPTNNIVIALTERAATLQHVEIVGRAATKYTSDYTFSATRTAILNKNLPQAISAITKELIADRQAFHLADAVKVVSGVAPSSFYNQYNIRGISQNEEGQIINGMRTRQFYFLQPLTANIERVEVIKGPASATFASVDPGGSINLVTKKPLVTPRREITIASGSFSTMRAALDFTGPLNHEKTLLYRINAAYQDAKSFRDFVGNKSVLVSPSFSYLPSENTAVNIEMIFSNMQGNLDRGQPIFGAVAGVTNLNSTPISLNLGAPNDYFRSKEMIMMGTFSHKFSSKVGFTTSYMKQTWAEDLQEHRTTNAFAVDTSNTAVSSLAGMQFVQRRQHWNIDNVQSYFTLQFNTGQVAHNVLVSYDFSSWQKLKGGGQNAARGFLLKDGTVANTFVKANVGNYRLANVNGAVVPMPNVPHFNLSNPLHTLRNPHEYVLNVRTVLPAALTVNHALYVQEQLQWKAFTLLLSLRQEFFKDITNYQSTTAFGFTNTALLPRVGATYALQKNTNVYATYLRGFQLQSNTVTLMPSTSGFFGTAKSAAMFQPLSSDLKEIGVKSSLMKNTLHMNAAVYQIRQRNILMNANNPAYPDSLVTRGADRSRGVEMDVAGYLLPNWQVNASYSHINAVVVEDAKAELVGARKENTPAHSANLWTRYNIAGNGILKDIGFGAGLQYSSSRVPWFNRSFMVPAFTVFDAAVYYNPGKSNMQLALNANNVFNTTYWIGAQNYLRLFPGAPRNLVMTATYKF